MVESRPKKVSVPPSKDTIRLKVALLGDGAVGKSSIADRYCYNSFDKTYNATIAVDYKNKILMIKDQQVNLNLWDFSGYPEFFEVRNEFYKEVNAIILTFDLCSKKSLDGLDNWMREANKYGTNKDAVVFVVGNKSDENFKRSVGESDGKGWANSRGFTYWEVSALKGDNINEMFEDLIQKCLPRK